MAQDKRSFLLYCDIIHTVTKLTDVDAGQLFKHMLEYVNDLNPVTKNMLVDIAFEPIKQQLKRDLKKYELIREKRSNAGLASVKAKRTKSTHVKSEQQTPTHSTVNDNVNDSVIVNDIDNNEIIFELFRKKFPGTKRGLETEFENLKKKHKDWKNIINLLSTAIDNQIISRETKKQKAQFVPEWKNMQTWINQRCWEEEIQTNTTAKVYTPSKLVY